MHLEFLAGVWHARRLASQPLINMKKSNVDDKWLGEYVVMPNESIYHSWFGGGHYRVMQCFPYERYGADFSIFIIINMFVT